MKKILILVLTLGLAFCFILKPKAAKVNYDLIINGTYVFKRGTTVTAGPRIDIPFESNNIQFSSITIGDNEIYYDSLIVYQYGIWPNNSYSVISFNNAQFSSPTIREVFYEYYKRLPTEINVYNNFFVFFEKVNFPDPQYRNISTSFTFVKGRDKTIYKNLVFEETYIKADNQIMYDAPYWNTDKYQVLQFRNAEMSPEDLDYLTNFGYFTSVPTFDPYDFKDLLYTTADVPFKYLSNIFSFELFGINLFTALTGIASLALLIIIIKRLTK
jgi:hypothetical protein|nr:MAG TPA: hypothetical protein [Inoviridae sp.]